MLRFAIVCLCACGRVGFEPTELVDSDGPLAEPVFNGGFANPVSLGVDGSDPQLRRDGLELWISFQTPSYELRVARRNSGADAFPIPTVAAVDSPASETDPSLTTDGTEIFFVSSRNSETQLYTSVRGMPSDDFLTDSLVPGIEDFGTFSATLVGDDVLYLVNGAGMARSERSGGGFSEPVPVEAPIFGWPTLSADELELFGNVDPSVEIAVVYATRRTKGEPFTLVNKLDFGEPCGVNNTLGDPQLSNDGKTLVIRCGGQIVLLSR